MSNKRLIFLVKWILLLCFSPTLFHISISNIALAAESFGTNLGSFNSVPSYSNCSNLCTTCNNDCNSYNYIDGKYIGIKWQCVEYVRRYFYQIYGLDLATKHRGDANTFYANATKMDLNRYANDEEEIPNIGDILVSEGGGYGHVAIVRSVSSNQVCTIQQNFSNTTTDANRCLSMTISDGNYKVSGFSSSYPIKGWLRAKNAILYDAEFHAQDPIDPTYEVNSTHTFTLSYTNTGTDDWKNTDDISNPQYIELRSVNSSGVVVDSAIFPDDGSWISKQRVVSLNAANVAPGENGWFIFNTKMPSTPGDYYIYFQPYHATAGFIGETRYFNIKVAPNPNLSVAMPWISSLLFDDKIGTVIQEKHFKLSAKSNSTVGIESDGTIVATGDNQYGQCNVDEWTDIMQVSAGGRHTVALKTNNTVIAAGGENDDFYKGQCNVDSWTNIEQVAAGVFHTVGLQSNGSVVAIGYNDYGQCNLNTWANIVQVDAGYGHSAGRKSDGGVVAIGNNTYGECNVDTWTDIAQVATGYWFTIGLKSDGTVLATGLNQYGQCNVDEWTDIVQVSAGHYHTVGLKSYGTVVAAGSSVYGACDVDTWTDIVHVAAGLLHTVGLKSDGTVVAAGRNDVGQCNVLDWQLGD